MKPKGIRFVTEEVEKDVTFLVDVDPLFVSLVKHGANQQPFRVIKEENDKADLAVRDLQTGGGYLNPAPMPTTGARFVILRKKKRTDDAEKGGQGSGDSEGHPFRGNQYSGGGGGGGEKEGKGKLKITVAHASEDGRYVITDNGEPIELKDAQTGEVKMVLPRYGVWDKEAPRKPQVIETSNDLEALKKKYKAEKGGVGSGHPRHDPRAGTRGGSMPYDGSLDYLRGAGSVGGAKARGGSVRFLTFAPESVESAKGGRGSGEPKGHPYRGNQYESEGEEDDDTDAEEKKMMGDISRATYDRWASGSRARESRKKPDPEQVAAIRRAFGIDEEEKPKKKKKMEVAA